MAEAHDAFAAIAPAVDARVQSWLVAAHDTLPGATAVPQVSTGLQAPDLPAPKPVAVDLLDGVRVDHETFDFTRQLLEAVIGSSDPFAAALGLREVSRDLPDSMPKRERLAVRLGGIASLGLPWAVLPIARKWLQSRLSHLVLVTGIPQETDDPKKMKALRSALAEVSHGSSPVVLALAGAQVLGHEGVRREARRLSTLIAQPEVTHVAVNVARLAPLSMAGEWALDTDAEQAATTLRELLAFAAEHHTALTLEASDYRGASLLAPVLTRALKGDGLLGAQVGVHLPAELPESLQLAEHMIRVSRDRVAAGGTPIEIVIGASVSVGNEQIASLQRGLAVPTLEEAAEQQGQFLRVLRVLLESADTVRVGAASEDPSLLAIATLLAEHHGVLPGLTLHLRAGVAPELETALLDHGFAVRRRLPIVTPREFDGLLDSLIALAAESSKPDSALARTRALLAREPGAPEASHNVAAAALAAASEVAPPSRRVQRRDIEFDEQAQDTVAFYREPASDSRPDTGGLTAAVLALTRAHTGELNFDLAGPAMRIPVTSDTGFANEPDTDATRHENRLWARGLLERSGASDLGVTAVKEAALGPAEANNNQPELVTANSRAADTTDAIDARIINALGAAAEWGALRPSERANRVARCALETAAARSLLVAVLAAESGAPIGVIDHDVNGTIDAARYLAQLTPGLGSVRGASHQPDQLTLVVADAAVPLAERAEAVLAALSAGSAVLLLAHPSVARSSAVLIETWVATGLPIGAVTLVVALEGSQHEQLAVQLAADTRVVRALVNGSRSTAQAMLRRRPDLQVDGRFREHGVTVIAPTADLDQAVRDTVASAFGCGHGDARSAKVLILLGAAAKSKRLRRQLEDAVRSITVADTSAQGDADPLSIGLGPLPEPPGEAGVRALTELGDGETWLVQPEQLDDEGRLWSPGVRLGVKRDSQFWGDAVGVPVIGVIDAHSVDEALSLVNELGGGGVAALHSHDQTETLPWLERARAASLVVGRPTTSTRTERQPDGGWGRAGIGSASLRGGPNRLLGLGTWVLQPGSASSTLHLRGLKPEVSLLIEAVQPSLDFQSFDRVRRAALADALTWRTSLGGVRDVSGLGIERNLLRRWPVSTQVRFSEQAMLGDLVRVLAAGLVAGAPMSVSTGSVLPQELNDFLAKIGITVLLERDEDWLERVAVNGPNDGSVVASRVRLIGGNRTRAAEWLGGLGDITLWAQPVTMAGPVELLSFVREQSVTITSHRHGLALVPDGIASWISDLQARV